MAMPDARKTFGQLSAGAANAPRAAQIVPEETIQSATLPHLVMSRLADTAQDLGEKMRLAGINNDKQKIEAYGAELGSREAQIRQDQLKEQQDKGEMWTPEQLTENYNQRLTAARAELAPKYKVDWIGDQKDAFEKQWMSKANEQYQRSVVAPRMADIGRRTVEETSQNHIKRAATLSASGDILGSLAAVGEAVNSYDTGNAPYLFTPEHRSQMKARVASDATMKALVTDPKRGLELVQASLAVREGVEKSGDASGLMADPMRNIPTLKLLDWKNDFGAAVHAQEKLAEQEQKKQQSIAANGYQNELILFTTDPRTTPAILSQRLMLERNKMTDMIKNDPGNPMLDVMGRGVVQMTNEIEAQQRKAEAAAEKASKKRAEGSVMGDFVSSGGRVDPSDPKSRKMGDGLFGTLATQHGLEKMNPNQRKEFVGAFVERFGYLPEKVERDLKQRANSNDEAVAADAINQLGSLARRDPNVMGQLNKGWQTVINNVTRHGIPPSKALKAQRESQLWSPEEEAVVESRAKTVFDPVKGSHRASKVVGSLFKGAVIPPKVEAAYNANSELSFKTNGQDPDAASKDGTTYIEQNFSVSKTDGKKVVRFRQPDKFGIAEPDLKYQQEKALKGFTLREKGTDPTTGKDVVIEKQLDGTEKTQYTYVGQKPNGNPVYRINVLDKRSGIPKPLVDARGPIEIEFDPKDKKPAPVIVKAPGLAERTGKTGNTLANAAAGFSTQANPALN